MGTVWEVNDADDGLWGEEERGRGDEERGRGTNLGGVYTITQITKDTAPIIINPQAKQFTVPFSPILKSISFEFTNSPCTSFKLVLTAEHVNIDHTYTLRLASGETFAVTFSTPEKGETGSHPIGTNGTLDYGREYTIAELRADSSLYPMRKQVDTFTTLPKPAERFIVVVRTGSAETEECGGTDKPCDSVRRGWEVGMRRDGAEESGVVVMVRREVGLGRGSSVVSFDFAERVGKSGDGIGVVGDRASLVLMFTRIAAVYPIRSQIVFVLWDGRMWKGGEFKLEGMKSSPIPFRLNPRLCSVASS
ncbi:hypothetical protein BLNAU_22655 [Blattamonas nauphoetae]|uniref:Uncharacterized protein n=1 Tax=Blattamonas nauphoetae TaxID=2049346 RepID=A0ABQ9WSF0_9EUKA|nr:hypothetical protein BLNAU_22655 [Blattamonas nauphoetae]